MFFLILYLVLILAELIFVISFIIFTLSLIFSSLKGSPFVPTKNQELEIILKEAQIKKGQYLLELGCGDGRFLRKAVENYQIKGLGIDVNPLLILLSNLYTKIKKISNLKFQTKNIFDQEILTEIKKADIIYLFLMPKLLEKLAPIFLKNCKKNTLIISHGFKFTEWDNLLFHKLERRPFPTYYYKLE